MICPCGSGAELDDCCGALIAGAAPETAVALMRSRYTAFVLGDVSYLLESWHPQTRPPSLALDERQRWLGLKVVDSKGGGPDDDVGEVAFVARFKVDGRGHRLTERSRFRRVGGRWKYVDGVVS